MKLNLGCGEDVKEGYVNVDFRDISGVQNVDLSKFPWPWKNDSIEEVLMLDFLEHFPRNQTDSILTESWRVLNKDGKLIVQVPDLEHCARAASYIVPFLCNRCGWEYGKEGIFICPKCSQPWSACADAAVQRLYGGQNYTGNWHFTSFSVILLQHMLSNNGFEQIRLLEGEHQYKNWNIKLTATKSENLWGDE